MSINQTILSGNYNVSKLIDTNMATDPTTWFVNFNTLVNGWFVLGLLVSFGFITFLIAKEKVSSDSEALLIAGIGASFIGLLMFLVEAVSGVKLLTFAQLSPIIIFTGVMVFLNFVNRRY